MSWFWDALYAYGCVVGLLAFAGALAFAAVFARFAAADFHRAGRARVAAYAGGPLRPTPRHTHRSVRSVR